MVGGVLWMSLFYGGEFGAKGLMAFLSTRHSWFSAGFFIGSHGFRLFGVWFTVFGSGAAVSGAPQRVVQCSVGFRVLGCRVQGFGGDSRWVEVVQCSAKFTATGWGGAIGGRAVCNALVVHLGYTQGEFGMPNARSEYDSWGYTQGEFGVPNARSEYDSWGEGYELSVVIKLNINSIITGESGVPNAGSEYDTLGYTQGESGVPNAGSEYMIPECDTSCKLSVGQKFDTLENGIQFYKRYAMVVGFDVRQSTVTKSRTGEVDVSMGSIQLQQATAQQNTIPGGTLQHQVWMDFNACMGMARGDDQRLLQISHAMSEVKQKIQTDGRTVVAKLGNAAVIQTMCGTPSSLPVTIRPPVVAKNKGSGKRLKGAREKAVTTVQIPLSPPSTSGATGERHSWVNPRLKLGMSSKLVALSISVSGSNVGAAVQISLRPSQTLGATGERHSWVSPRLKLGMSSKFFLLNMAFSTSSSAAM
nr:protein FAR1-RELATED SEQUENCE 5-like [Ipomoea batatas]